MNPAFAGSMIGLAPLKFAGVLMAFTPWVIRCVHRRSKGGPTFAFRGHVGAGNQRVPSLALDAPTVRSAGDWAKSSHQREKRCCRSSSTMGEPIIGVRSR